MNNVVTNALIEKGSIMLFKHIKGMSVDAVFSNCNNYRYKLTVQNNNSPGSKMVCIIMQNPSVANAEIADKSFNF